MQGIGASALQRGTRTGRLLVALLVACGVWAQSPGSAGAQVVGRLGSVPVAGPVLAGPRVLWGEQVGGRVALKIADTPADVQTVRVFAPAPHPDVPGQTGVTLSLAASASYALVGVENDFLPGSLKGVPYAQEQHVPQPFGGAPSGPLSAVGPQCRAPDGAPPAVFAGRFLSPVAVSGTVVAYFAGCQQIVVRDLADASVSSPTLPPDSYAPRVAGRYLAYLQGPPGGDTPGRYSAITVFDRVAGRQVYRFPAGTIRHEINDISVGEDGSIAVAYRVNRPPKPEKMGVSVASVQRPVLRQLLPVSGHYGIRLAAGRVVLVGQQGPSTGVVSHGQLLVSDLAGHVQMLAAPVDDQTFFGRRFDWDGQNVTWVTRTCDQALINVAPLSGVRSERHDLRHCRLLLSSPPRVRHRQVQLHIACLGLTPVCIADHTRVLAIGPIAGRRGVLIAKTKSDYWGGSEGGFTIVPLTTAGKRLLAHHHRVRVRISTRLGDDLRFNYPFVRTPIRTVETMLTVAAGRH